LFEGSVSVSAEVTALFCVDPEAGRGAVREIATALGLDLEQGRRLRWHEPGCLLVRLSPTQAVIDLGGVADSLASVLSVQVMPAGERPLLGVAARSGPVVVPQAAPIGGDTVTLIGGPCSVEHPRRVAELALALAESGCTMLRGGAFKPRTSPYAFGGVGPEALEWLAEAGRAAGLPVVTEVMREADVGRVAARADVLQIGSRNMHNFPLLFAAGAHAGGKPVLLKRGFGATITEYLFAAEYVLLGRLYGGHDQPGLILCERGIRAFEPGTRYTLDINAVPLLKAHAGVPVIVDPSHAIGLRDFVGPLARASVAAGADGVMLEVHEAPDAAWSDGAQSVTVADFALIARDLAELGALSFRRR
jgi:3-deoxy-7-phosphoheptulonate synthase